MHKEFIFTREIIARVRELAFGGNTDQTIAGIIGLHPSTFCLKKKEVPELAEALAQGRSELCQQATAIVKQMMTEGKSGERLKAALEILRMYAAWNKPEITNITFQTKENPALSLSIDDLLAEQERLSKLQ